MIEDRIDHLLVAVNDVEDAVRKARLLHQLRQAVGDAGIALARLDDESVPTGDRHAEHPHRDHRREVERRNSGADAKWLAHRIDVDAWPGTDSIFTLQRLRDSTGIFDHLKAALNVALGVRDDLAVFG